MVNRKLFVEGAGNNNPSLASECRRAFSKLFEKAGVTTTRPRVVVCGGRKQAYDDFCHELKQATGEVWLLVDAEELPTSSSPWAHVKARNGDGWPRPETASDDRLHLMTVTMEAWLLSDPAALTRVFGPRFDISKLPPPASLEKTSKESIKQALAAAAKPTPSGKYEKGVHSFRALAEVDPSKLRRLTWASRFLDAMGARK